MSRWLPIEVAPKDGTQILVLVDSGYHTPEWHVESVRWRTRKPHPGFWVDDTGEALGDAYTTEVVCWQPMPRPPETSQ